MNTVKINTVRLLVFLFLYSVIQAQTGGDFSITQPTIASGGITDSTGGNFKIDGTIGQSLAGTNPSGGDFAVQNGFWFSTLVPTSAAASISGRVKSANGGGIVNVVVSLTNAATGEVSSVRSTSFGNFRFDDIPVGQSYILMITSKRFQFQQNSRFITLLESRSDEDFTALPE